MVVTESEWTVLGALNASRLRQLLLLWLSALTIPHKDMMMLEMLAEARESLMCNRKSPCEQTLWGKGNRKRGHNTYNKSEEWMKSVPLQQPQQP